MSIGKKLFGAVSLSLMAVGICLPARAQIAQEQATLAAESVESNIVNESVVVPAAEPIEPTVAAEVMLGETSANGTVVTDVSLIEAQSEAEIFAATEDVALDELRTASAVTKITPKTTPETSIAEPALDVEAVQPAVVQDITVQDITVPDITVPDITAEPTTEAAELAYPVAEDSVELAQRRPRRRTSGARGSSNFIGIGADFGYADDLSFAAISKFEFTDQLSVRPAVLLGDDFSILVPITYDFSRFGTDVGGFQLRPYAGAGVSYVSDDDDEINLLLSAGVDVPLSQRFTGNAQVNWGVLNDSDFGITVGVGYNLGNFFR